MPLRKLAADANVILSAVAGKAALRVFLLEGIEIATTEFNFSEVDEYIGVMANKYGFAKEILESQLKLLPLQIYDQKFYDDFFDNASKQLSACDKDDIDLLALSLKLNVPVWSNDRHFQHAGVEVYTTAKLLKILKA
jgi:predicted nucleic acid-binding protein